MTDPKPQENEDDTDAPFDDGSTFDDGATFE